MYANRVITKDILRQQFATDSTPYYKSLKYFLSHSKTDNLCTLINNNRRKFPQHWLQRTRELSAYQNNIFIRELFHLFV